MHEQISSEAMSDNLRIERNQKARLSRVINIINQALQIAIGFVSVPLTINYLSAELFAIWMALISLVTLLAYSDFGIGVGLQNSLTRAISQDDKHLARKVVINSFAFISAMMALMCMVSYLLIKKINWVDYLRINSGTPSVLIEKAVMLMVVMSLLGVFSTLLQRMVISFQDGFWSGLFQCISRVIVLIAMYWTVAKDGGFLWLIFSVQGVGAIVQIILLGLYLHHEKKWLLAFPGRITEYLDNLCLINILKIGLLGLGASLAYFVMTTSIPLSLTNRFGSASIVDYMILIKITSVPAMLAIYLYSPIWPAVTDAMAKRDFEWISTSLKKNGIVLLLLSGVSSLGIFFCADAFLKIWLHNELIAPSRELLLACILIMVLFMWNAYTSTYLNGMGRFKSQATIGLALPVLFFILVNNFQFATSQMQVIWFVFFGMLIRCIYQQIEVVMYVRQLEIHVV